ncbi:salicylate hydroxylase [Fusarium albosuccineum]|uniref:Salicylate hydroxylase n=1 Tax=Fusarium albosuccineum TaxID=1237068 RepID=A0A8H4L618_9HYPO|nr:salicylate hydroxylase [Fusarium albosuccineum]
MNRDKTIEKNYDRPNQQPTMSFLLWDTRKVARVTVQVHPLRGPHQDADEDDAVWCMMKWSNIHDPCSYYNVESSEAGQVRIVLRYLLLSIVSRCQKAVPAFRPENRGVAHALFPGIFFGSSGTLPDFGHLMVQIFIPGFDSSFEPSETYMVQQYGADWLMTLRKDFRAELLRLATEQRDGHGVTPTIRYNCRVVDIDVHDGEVELQGGQILEADLIVLASGIHSDLKDRILGSNRFVATPTGQSIFRFLVSAENATKAAGKLPEWWNPDVGAYLSIMRTNDDTNRALITYPCRDFKYVNFSCAFPNHLLRERAEESWPADGDHDEVMKIFKDFPAPYSTFMKFGNYAITTHYPLPTYVRGRAVLIGDAAHAMAPFQGQGGAQAIEDSEGFRLLADAGVSRQDVPAIFKRWDRAQRPRASQVQDNTR